MTRYALTADAATVLRDDGARVPADCPTNADSRDYMALCAAGGAADPYVPPVVAASVLSQDMLAQFTPADIVAVQNAINGNSTLLLMWYSLLAQRDPMEVGNARFQQGWAALKSVLGTERMAAIGAALGIPNG